MLSFNNVSFAYKTDNAVFSQLSCAIKEYSFTCVIGMNGSGKTTFAKLAVGALKPDAGTITYKNTSLSNIKIGYLQQTKAFGEQVPLSVFDFVLMGCLEQRKLFFNKKDAHKVEEALITCGLGEKRNTPIKQLSGGQVQRALIARLLISSPDLIVMDEPFGALDAEASDVLLRQLNQLKSKMTIIMVSHNFEMISALADHVLCISNHESHHHFLEYVLHEAKIPVLHICNSTRSTS